MFFRGLVVFWTSYLVSIFGAELGATLGLECNGMKYEIRNEMIDEMN